MSIFNAVGEEIGRASGQAFQLASYDSIGGGCISQAYRLRGVDGSLYFVKTNRADTLEMFAAEAEALAEMAATETITVPCPWCWGVEGDYAYLVMDYLPLGGRGSGRELGQQLAALHRHEHALFGWHRNNTIGSTFQDNTPGSDWVEFWRERRLGVQLQLARQNGYSGRLQEKGARLQEGFALLFDDYQPRPSLLHGDLWSGNYSFTQAGVPVIFDPASYYGDREADLAMTELFGGFGQDFYAAYDEAYPLDRGYAVRKTLYNLYHILNHLNLFGSGYAGQAEGMMDRLLGEIG